MKTILYQPLFINPQAYFVFPQLYHIEKGDSYIEPANITGQLIINNLSEGLTLTPTVNVIQDSNQIDFSLFKGKHIRISQYTNIGAVLLNIINEKANKKDVYTIAQTNDAINRSKTVVENVLTSTSTTTALSSAQGKILNDLITSLTARVQALETPKP